jgi:hypothetical protein
MPRDAEHPCPEAGPVRVAGVVSWGARLALATLVACSSSSGQSGGPGSTAGDWTGTESCNAWTLSSTPGAPVEAPIPVNMSDVSATVTEDDGGITITGLNIGPVARWSCPNQPLVGAPNGNSGTNGVNYFSFPATPCLAPVDAEDAGFAFQFTASGDTYSSDGRELLFLSLDLSAPAVAGMPNVSAVGSCTIYLTQP